MEKELEKALGKVASRLESLEGSAKDLAGVPDRLESLEGSAAALNEKVATLEESDIGARVGKLEEGSPQPATADEAVLKEKDDRIAELESRKISDYPGREQGAFMLEGLARMPAETVAVLLSTAGKGALLNEASAQLAQAIKTQAKAEEDESIIKGKTDKPGYHYMEMLDISIKTKE